MSNQVEYTAEVTGFDRVDAALQRQAKNLQQTATAAVKYDRAVKSIKPGSDQASQAIINLGRVAQDAPFGFLGIANNIEPLLTSFKSLGAASGGAQGALKALGSSLIGPNGLILAFSAFQFVALGGIDVIKKFFQSASEVQKIEAAKKALDEYKKAVDGIFSAAAKENAEVLSLITVINSEVETRKRKLAALEQLKKINPDIFNGLKLEQGAVTGLDAAYQKYIANLQNVVAAKVIQFKLEEKIKQVLELQGVAQSNAIKNLGAAFNKINQDRANALKGLGDQNAVKTLQDIATYSDRIKSEKIAKLNAEINDLGKELSEFSAGVLLDPLKNDKKVRTISDVLSDLGKQIDFLNKKEVVLNISQIDEKKAALKSAIDELLKDFNLDPGDTILAKLVGFNQLSKIPGLRGLELRTAVLEKLKQQFNGDINLPGTIKLTGVKIEIPLPKDLINEGDFKERLDQLKEDFRSAMENIAEDIAFSFGETLGKALTGKVSFWEFFDSIFRQVGAGLKQLGKVLIKYAIQVKAIKDFAAANPALAIAAGITLVALGSALQEKLNKQAFATGTRFAPGGLALVGERGPELMSVPRGAQITPAAQTANLLGGMGGAFIAETRVAGSDLLLVLKRAEKSYSRTA